MVGSDVCPIDVSFQGCTHVGFQKVDALQDSEAQRRLARLLRGGLRKTDEKGRAFFGKWDRWDRDIQGSTTRTESYMGKSGP